MPLQRRSGTRHACLTAFSRDIDLGTCCRTDGGTIRLCESTTERTEVLKSWLSGRALPDPAMAVGVVALPRWGSGSLKRAGQSVQFFCEPVWPSGRALCWQAGGPRFDPLRLSFLSNKQTNKQTIELWFMDTCVVTLPTQLMKHYTVSHSCVPSCRVVLVVTV